MPIKKGLVTNEKGAPKGGQPGAGRPLNWVKELARDIVRKDKLLERLAIIARGEDIPQPISNGEVISIPAPVSEQRKAILDIVERGFGKVEQGIEITHNDESRPSTDALIATITALRAELDASRTGTGVAQEK